ncbi:MAG: membrane protein insertase YidC [Verrucomicrobia bacterium]|nr:MAG: membrane protein insertase YidC [Verrucomicrobiota bacterium]
MDRRTLFALLLTAIVIVVTPMLFPAPKQPRRPARDTTRAPRDSVASVPTTEKVPQASVSVAKLAAPNARTTAAETTVVRTNRAVYYLTSPGGTPSNITLPEYHSLRPDAPRSTPVSLIDGRDRLFHLRVVTEHDTIALDTVVFKAAPQRREGSAIIQSLSSVSNATPITLTYRFPVDSFVAHLDGTIGAGTATARQLLVMLPSRIHSEEANTLDDTRHLAIGFKSGAAEVTSVTFRQMDAQAARLDTGAIRWVSERNKYFVVAMVPEGRDSTFRSLLIHGAPRTGSEATMVQAVAALPITAGHFAMKVYAGPQSWDHLRKAAPDLENVNPYGGWLHAVVQPFATIVMRLLLWIRHTLNVSYGWVLVIFGVLVRLLLWPLNQNAMRSSMKLQRIQPQLAEVQKKYARDPEKQRDAMLKLYQEHGMSPFTPVLGCLPMLLPMPILFALYFVFQNTIELRGVSFLWMPDLSLRDPLFITPLFMGISMFVLSWIGMRGMPPSPQSKMMSYVMPVMFTALFWNFASGLNLYYAVQNVAALPQQWLLARERTSKAVSGTGTARERG